MIYYKHVNQVVEQSLCIISNDLTVSFVYKVMPESINFIKQKVNPEIEKVHFSQTDVLDSTKTKNIFLTYAFIKWTLMLIVFGIFCHKSWQIILWWHWWHSQKTSYKSQPAEAYW